MGCKASKPHDVAREGATPKCQDKKHQSASPTCQGINHDAKLIINRSPVSCYDGGDEAISPRHRHEVLDTVYSHCHRSVANTRIIRHHTLREIYDLEPGILGTGIGGPVRPIAHKGTGRKAALKSLSTKNMTPQKWEFLYNEVEVYLKLDHPNICKLLEVYEDEEAVHLVMEKCTGKELFDRLASRRRYTEHECVLAVTQMLHALHYLHMHKVVHRDLKLENWVYSDNRDCHAKETGTEEMSPKSGGSLKSQCHSENEDGKLKLIDFGFSRTFNADLPMTTMHGTIYYVAPEVMKGSYDHKCDIWSLGVIVYMLLSGTPPFNGDSDEDIIAKIQDGRWGFDGPRWVRISTEAKDFIRLLLRKSSTERPTALSIIGHPWIVKDRSSHSELHHEISMEVLVNMRRFASLNAMTRAACGLIAFSLTSEEMEDLEKQFEELDTEQNGALTLHELTTALVDHLKISPAEAKAVFNRMDQTGDQEIHYSEFLAASLQSRFLLQEKILRDAFNKFDLDNSGHISAENLRTVFGDEYNGTAVEDIIKEVDWKHNGTIDYEEFVQEMMDMVDTKEQDMINLLNNAKNGSSRSDIRSLSEQKGEFELKFEEVGEAPHKDPRPCVVREASCRSDHHDHHLTL